MTQKPVLRVEVGARALRNQTGGGGEGERVQRPVGALARVCVSGPQNRKRSQEGINPPSELSRSLSRHNHGAAGGGHPIIELPCILYQTPRTLIREQSSISTWRKHITSWCLLNQAFTRAVREYAYTG